MVFARVMCCYVWCLCVPYVCGVLLWCCVVAISVIVFWFVCCALVVCGVVSCSWLLFVWCVLAWWFFCAAVVLLCCV